MIFEWDYTLSNKHRIIKICLNLMHLHIRKIQTNHITSFIENHIKENVFSYYQNVNFIVKEICLKLD